LYKASPSGLLRHLVLNSISASSLSTPAPSPFLKVEAMSTVRSMRVLRGQRGRLAWRPGVRKIFVLSLPRRLGVSRAEPDRRAAGHPAAVS